MKLSIVILCWNDRNVILDCVRSIVDHTHSIGYEVIISDNGSTDGAPDEIERLFPQVRVLRNGTNLGFAKGNNAGIAVATGEYVLILNPDTIIHPGALDRWTAFADMRPGAGAFGCRVLNPDGSFQSPSRPFPTVRRAWISALYLRKLARISRAFESDVYVDWTGEEEREIDWQSGCCVMFRGELLRKLGGFDEQFFYQYEEVDLCRRVWDSGSVILFTPQATITHLGGQSVNRFPLRFAIEKQRNRYKYFYKYFGSRGARGCRRTSLVSIKVRQIGYGLKQLLGGANGLEERLRMYSACYHWNAQIDPVRFVEQGEEPSLDVDTTRRQQSQAT